MASAASSATMDLAYVIPQLLEGISQELGVEAKDFKLVILANREDIDPQPLRQIAQWHEGLEWEFKPTNPLHNPKPCLEIELKGDNLLMRPQTKSQASIACVKGSNRYTDGSVPASLCQVGSYGSCLSALRSKMICDMVSYGRKLHKQRSFKDG